MKTTLNTITGFAFIILDKIYLTDLFCKFTLREGFEKVTTVIFKKARFNDDNTLYSSFDYFHCD